MTIPAAPAPPIPLGRAAAIAEPFLTGLRTTAGVYWVSPAGGLRRGAELIDRIEIVVCTDDPERVRRRVFEIAGVTVTAVSDRVEFVRDGAAISVTCAPPEAAGATLLDLTGSTWHVDALHAYAADRGLLLSRAGLFEGARRVASTEDEIYAALGLPFIPPEIRDGSEELARGQLNRIPALVSRDDIRGDLHMHTRWSDGRDSVEDMVQAAVALGYDYLAITDHSQSSAAIRNLEIDAVAKQADEIANIRHRYPQIAILHGCEVDILPDGSLDFPDAVLEQFDIVLASLHDRAGHSPDELLARYERAMRHPRVSIVTHPTNRVFPTRPGYELDFDRLFELAVETGTALEIDGAPSHLDLDSVLALRAQLAGVTLTIDSDCHRSETLGLQMDTGIRLARGGWVEPRHVLNTRPLSAVLAWIDAKRNSA